jgi:acetyl-CoA acyltransferase
VRARVHRRAFIGARSSARVHQGRKAAADVGLNGNQVFIVDAVRTPFGKSHPDKGMYRDTHPNVLLGTCLTGLVERSGIDPGVVEDVIVGCAQQFGEQSRNIARNAWLQVGYPPETPAVSLDRRCGSGQTAITLGAGLIASGTCDVVIAGGVEHMQRVPADTLGRQIDIFGDPWPAELTDRYHFVNQGISAEIIADKWGITRREMDELAVLSHHRSHVATIDGRFSRELVRVAAADGEALRDQGIRPDTEIDKLALLRTPFKPDGRITAATSSQISDGAGAVLLASEAAVQRYGLNPRALIIDQTTVGVDPVIMLTGPIPATQRLLDRNGLSVDDIDLFEINEAFASVVLAWEREIQPDPDRVNVNGGALAIGHPVGASGARLIATITSELERSDKELGLVSMCCGGGFGTGTIVQRFRR